MVARSLAVAIVSLASCVNAGNACFRPQRMRTTRYNMHCFNDPGTFFINDVCWQPAYGFVQEGVNFVPDPAFDPSSVFYGTCVPLASSKLSFLFEFHGSLRFAIRLYYTRDSATGGPLNICVNGQPHGTLDTSTARDAGETLDLEATSEHGELWIDIVPGSRDCTAIDSGTNDSGTVATLSAIEIVEYAPHMKRHRYVAGEDWQNP